MGLEVVCFSKLELSHIYQTKNLPSILLVLVKLQIEYYNLANYNYCLRFVR